jgi:formylglycine-generating enzyme required for sulfatase activity
MYPFGNDAPVCHEVVYGRFGNNNRGFDLCKEEGLGPVATHDPSFAETDLSPSGIVSLGGNVSEWVLDAHEPYDAACWRSQRLLDPACWDEDAPYHSVMGGSWRDGPGRTRGATRARVATGGLDSSVGFRCAYEEEE